MKKTKLWLSLAVAVAVVTTAATSFAAWDQLSDTAGGTLTLQKPVVVTATDATYALAARALDATNATYPTYTGEVKFNVADLPSDVTPVLTLDPKVMNGATEVTGLTVEIKKGSGDSATALTDGTKDTGVKAGDNTYTVTVTATDDAALKALAAAGTELTVNVEGTLSAAVTPAP